MQKTIVIMAALLLASLAWGVDLKNEDSVEYQLLIKDGPTETHSSISGNTTKASICSDCTIVVEGVGEIAAAGDKVVVIKDGALSIAE